jgi:hypothetical protein
MTATQDVTTLASASPKLGVPLLDAFRISHGPKGVLGRFFLLTSDRMQLKGIRLEFASFEEIERVHAANTDSWPDMNPVFNTTVADTSNSFCIVGRDDAGRVVATCAGKRFDASARSFTQIVNDGDFYSLRPGKMAGLTARMNSKTTDTMHGRIGYSGGLWIHPDFRHHRLPAVFCRLVTATMLAHWDTEIVLGAVAAQFDGTDYARRYGYAHEAPMLCTYVNGQLLREFVLLWMTAGETAIDLARFVDVLWPQFDAAVIARSTQQSA